MFARTGDMLDAIRFCQTCESEPVSLDERFCSARCAKLHPTREQDENYRTPAGRKCRVCRRRFTAKDRPG